MAVGCAAVGNGHSPQTLIVPEKSPETILVPSGEKSTLKMHGKPAQLGPPNAQMAPPPHFLELAQEMELLIYGAAGAYDATLQKISSAHSAQLARKTAALLLQRVARRHQAVAKRHALFLERSAMLGAASAMGAGPGVDPNASQFCAASVPAAAGGASATGGGAGAARLGGSHPGKSINQASLLLTLEADEAAQEAHCAASSEAHRATLEECTRAMEELELAQREERSRAHAEVAIKNAATSLQRCTRRFLRRMTVAKEERKRKASPRDLEPGFLHAQLNGEGSQSRLSV